MGIPHIEDYYHTKVLMVDDQPFLAYAGEIHNSNCSQVDYFREHVLPKINHLGLNTVILPVYWEQIEKEEGQFDFHVFDEVIDLLRKENLKAVVLWFGLWKNAKSSYIPAWMKENRKTYPFIKKEDQTPIYTITPLCQEAIEKDGYAFFKLMEHIKEKDQGHQTVIMVQVENEIGCLSTNRDYSEEANAMFAQEIPSDMQTLMSKKGTWEECFQADSHEMFMAYHFAKAIEYIAQCGKRIYPLPLIVNVWLKKPHEKAGQYPSGGPIQDKIDLYHYLAPSIDLVCPDIYVTNFREICDVYASQGALFIPETRQDIHYISHAIYAYTQYPCLGYSPFGIEDFANEDSQETNNHHIMKLLGIVKEAFHPEGTQYYLKKIYQQLSSFEKILLKKRGTDDLWSFLNDNEEKCIERTMNDLKINVQFLDNQDCLPIGVGCILKEDKYLYIYGMRFFASLFSLKTNEYIGILELEEGHFENGQWIVERVLNGDEQYFIAVGNNPRFLRVHYHQYSE